MFKATYQAQAYRRSKLFKTRLAACQWLKTHGGGLVEFIPEYLTK